MSDLKGPKVFGHYEASELGYWGDIYTPIAVGYLGFRADGWLIHVNYESYLGEFREDSIQEINDFREAPVSALGQDSQTGRYRLCKDEHGLHFSAKLYLPNNFPNDCGFGIVAYDHLQGDIVKDGLRNLRWLVTELDHFTIPPDYFIPMFQTEMHWMPS